MKKISILAATAGIVLMSSGAIAAGLGGGSPCDGTAGSKQVAGDNAKFIKTTFNTPCSNNVFLKYDQSSSAAWAAAASVKGACFTIGHTDAGARPSDPQCSPANAQFKTPEEAKALDTSLGSAETMAGSS